MLEFKFCLSPDNYRVQFPGQVVLSQSWVFIQVFFLLFKSIFLDDRDFLYSWMPSHQIESAFEAFILSEFKFHTNPGLS